MGELGPEDSSKWRHPSNASARATIEVCVKCKKLIKLYHCAETGCPWCANCGGPVKNYKPTKGIK